MSEQEYQDAIQKFEWEDLVAAWRIRHEANFLKEWAQGKFFEYAIIRAFEIEGATVRYPYRISSPSYISDDEDTLEQIDGVIYIDGLSFLVESKDYAATNIDIEPLAKLQVRLKRRPSPVVGCLFTASDFTWPAQALIETLMPHTILLWNKADIDYCFEHHCFIKGLRLKYKSVIEDCNHMLDISTYANITEKPAL